MTLIAILALAALIGGTTHAHAGFIVAPIAAAIFGAGTIAAGIATAIGGAALAIGASYLASKLLAPETQRAQAGGVQFDLRADPDVPESLIVGRAVTAGSLVHGETFGKRTDGQGNPMDNSDLIEIFGLADHPCEGLVSVYVEEEERSLSPDDGYRGQVLPDFTVPQAAKLAIRFYDGTQTTADAFAVDKLGGHAERPWTNQMVGRGRCYVRAHSIYGGKIVPGRLRWRFVVDGALLYDPRKDTTAGGSGSHRWDDLDTHEFTANLIVIAYNIMRGIRVKNADGDPVHFYGLEGTKAEQLPLDVWFAAMNEADTLIDGEPQFHGGAEITVDTEPREVLLEIMKACDGRFVEVGGVYKVYVGAPMLPVLSFDDGVLRADEGDSFKPVKPLEQRVNHVTGKYTSPEDGWIPKVAPARFYPDGEAVDGRRVSANLDAPMIQSDDHAQRIMQQMLNRARKERRHNIPLPASCWGVVEPGRFLAWSSERNGYADKLFEIDAVDDDHNFNLIATITEVDETDYDWDGETDLLPSVIGSLVTDRPAPQIIDGFDAEPFIHAGDNGVRRPAIRVTWNDPENDDLFRVAVQMRRPASVTNVVNWSTDEPAALEMIILAGLAPVTDYEVRGRFVSENGYDTQWSLWIPVTTPDARVSRSEMDAALDALLKQLDIGDQASIWNQIEDIRYQLDAEVAQALVGISSTVDIQSNRIVTQIGEETANSRALITTLQQTTADEFSAIAQDIQTLDSEVGDNTASITSLQQTTADEFSAIVDSLSGLLVETPQGIAQGTVRFRGVSGPPGVAASYSIDVRASTGDDWAVSGMRLDAGVTSLGGASRIRFAADSFQIATSLTEDGVTVFGVDTVNNRVTVKGELVAGKIASPDGLVEFDLDGRSLTFFGDD